MNNALFRSVVIIIAATLLCRSTLAKITVLPDEEIDHVDDSAPPFYQECKKTSDCPASYCCVLGKYSCTNFKNTPSEILFPNPNSIQE